jgi:hypothetical protein
MIFEFLTSMLKRKIKIKFLLASLRILILKTGTTFRVRGGYISESRKKPPEVGYWKDFHNYVQILQKQAETLF